MAVTYDNAIDEYVTAGSTISKAIVIGSNPNRYLWIGISWQDLSPDGSILASVTVGSVEATFVDQKTDASNIYNVDTYQFINPGTGSVTVTVTWDNGLGSDQVDAILGVLSVYNVDQVTPLAAGASATGTSPPVTVDVAGTASGNLVVDTVSMAEVATTIGAGQTLRWSNIASVYGQKVLGRGSTEPAGGTITMSWTFLGTKKWTTIAYEIVAAVVAATSNKRTLLGAGI